jgi:hypothetical protein
LRWISTYETNIRRPHTRSRFLNRTLDQPKTITKNARAQKLRATDNKYYFSVILFMRSYLCERFGPFLAEFAALRCTAVGPSLDPFVHSLHTKSEEEASVLPLGLDSGKFRVSNIPIQKKKSSLYKPFNTIFYYICYLCRLLVAVPRIPPSCMATSCSFLNDSSYLFFDDLGFHRFTCKI